MSSKKTPNKKKKARKVRCKQCGLVFTATGLGDQFCTLTCADKYLKERTAIRNIIESRREAAGQEISIKDEKELYSHDGVKEHRYLARSKDMEYLDKEDCYAFDKVHGCKALEPRYWDCSGCSFYKTKKRDARDMKLSKMQCIAKDIEFKEREWELRKGRKRNG